VCILSDLANCCEYLTVEKLCSAVSESQKAKENRQLRCQNTQKTSCCYLCLSRPECAISCKYLGQVENISEPKESPKAKAQTTLEADTKTEDHPSEKPVFCSVCYVDMLEAKTSLNIGEWKGLLPKLSGDGAGKLRQGVLPVTVYLCPQCGKIELKADVEPNKK
jgi:hypothetical protein